MSKYLFFSAAVFLFSCSGSETGDGIGNDTDTLSTVIKPPFKGDFQNDTVFVIDPTKETLVESPNGSSIEIPANCIVDADGKPVKSKVEVSFIQYHSVADIISSGIPMVYDSAGVSNNFVSAGMFTLKAKSEGKEVFVKDGEKLTVNLASDKPDAMNFYELNEQSGDWTFQSAPTPVQMNPRFNPADRPIKPQKADKNAFVLDLNFDLSDYSELTAFNGIVWEYVGTDDSLDPRKNEQASKIKWKKFDLEPTYEQAYEYWLTMSAAQFSFKTKVKAALQGGDFEEAMASFKEKKKKIAAIVDRLQKPFIRSVNISGFSTYNYDYVHSMTAPEAIVADFDFGSESNNKESALVFVVYPENNVVVNYPPDYWEKSFAIDKDQEAHVLAVLPDNKFAVFKKNISDAFGKGSYTFKMDVLKKKVESKADLDVIMAEL